MLNQLKSQIDMKTRTIDLLDDVIKAMDKECFRLKDKGLFAMTR